jgi:integrase
MQDKIGIPYWTAHDLRRTFSTQLSAMGVAPHIVEKCLGHKLPKIMATYNQHEWLDERRDALNQWAEKIEILTGEKSNVVMLGARGEYGY